MDVGLAIALGALQGLTEFLPVSSSGHLRLLQEVAEVPEATTMTLFDIMLHVGTLLAVMIVYRGLIGRTIKATGRVLLGKEKLDQSPDARLAGFLVLAMVPTGIIGLTLGSAMEGLAQDLTFVGGALVANGFILLGLRHLTAIRIGQGRGLEHMTMRDALVIGSIQGLGIFRGISRSGATITAGIGSGLGQEAAASFSFLLSIPAILGALVLQLSRESIEAIAIEALVLGTLVSAVVGVIALKWLLKLLERGKLHHFAWYCLLLGATTITYGIIK
jgi:undecaprenyl-diphosphatase